MEVSLLLPLILLHVVTLFCAVTGDNVVEEYLIDTQSVTPRPTTLQNITTPQCDYCPQTSTQHQPIHRSTVLCTNHTAQGPSPASSPIEYVVVGKSGVCLRVKAIFKIMLNSTKMRNVIIPSPPITRARGNCFEDAADLALIFPGGYLRLIFEKNEEKRSFHMYHINMFIKEDDGTNIRKLRYCIAMVTPLGQSYTREVKTLKITPSVSVVLMDVRIQAFDLEGDNNTREAPGAAKFVIITPECNDCQHETSNNQPIHRSTVLCTNHTTPGPSPDSSPIEYVVVGRSGVCLRVKAVFIVMLNTTKMRNITIPSPPITGTHGGCYDGQTYLSLLFRKGILDLWFKANKSDSSFYLEHIAVTIIEEGRIDIDDELYLKAMVTPLGQSFTCDVVKVEIAPSVSIVLMDVKVQDFDLEGSNYESDDESTFIVYEDKSTNIFYDWLRKLKFSCKHWIVTKLVPSIYTIVFLVALPLNIMAIIMFLVKMKVRKPATVYMLNLATADVLLVSVLPFYIVYRFWETKWLIGDGMCRLVTAAFYCNMFCSVLLMTSISVDRFLGIVFPVRSLSWRTVTRAWLACGVIWVISLASIVPLLMREQIRAYPQINITLCHDIQHFGIYSLFSFYYFRIVFSLYNFLPLFVTTFCYIGIIRSLSRSQFDRTHKRSRAILLSVVVLCVFVLCFGPTNVIYLIHSKKMNKNEDLSLYIPYVLSSCISSINCCLDPLIYYFASSECQSYVYSLLPCKKDYRPPVSLKMSPVHRDQSSERTHPDQITTSG